MFKENFIFQLTGDAALSNLAVTPISPQGIGTNSPRSLCNSPKGLYFVASDGQRRINPYGTVEEPDSDVVVPFQQALYKTRISGSFNTGIYRVGLQRGDIAGNPQQDLWFHEQRKCWTGPHTVGQDMLAAYGDSFIASWQAKSHTLYQSDVLQTASSNMSEYGSALQWQWQTSPIDDSEEIYAGSTLQTTIEIAYITGPLTFNAIIEDEDGTPSASGTLVLGGASGTLWGSFTWGGANWGGGGGSPGLKPWQIPWQNTAVYNKPTFYLNGPSQIGFKIGTLKHLNQPLGYMKQ